MNRNNKEICSIIKCNNNVNNSLGKWQMDLCTFHLIEFIKWFNKDKKIRAVFDRFYDKWEAIKDSDDNKNKEKIKNKLDQLQVYFNKQEQLAIEFEKQNNEKMELEL